MKRVARELARAAQKRERKIIRAVAGSPVARAIQAAMLTIGVDRGHRESPQQSAEPVGWLGTVSAIVVSQDRSDTDACVAQLEGLGVPQVILAKNASAHALNAAARAATQPKLLFIDARLRLVLSRAAIPTARTEAAGVLAGRVVTPRGRVANAGVDVAVNGTRRSRGWGQQAILREHQFATMVHAASSELMLTPRALFNSLGAYDETLRVAHVADYCLRVWRAGREVLLAPELTAILPHVGARGNQKMPKERRELRAKHGAFMNLLEQRPFDPLCRQHAARILMIEDRVPHPYLGRGYPRSHRILLDLLKLGHRVTLYPMVFPSEPWEDMYADVPREVEVVVDHGERDFESFFKRHGHWFDIVLVSRPHNMRVVADVIQAHKRRSQRLIYDAEALFCMREVERQRIHGSELSDAEIDRLVRQEVEIARGADLVLSVSAQESAHFKRNGFARVTVLAHAVSSGVTPRSHAERNDALFVGPLEEWNSPNVDGMRWFIQDVLPLIRTRIPALSLVVAGSDGTPLQDLDSQGVIFLGRVDDLDPLYAAARIFAAPMRFSAGIPWKIHEAAARGVPVVTTPLVAAQLGWRHGEDLLVGSTPEEFSAACVRLYEDEVLWSAVRRSALGRVSREASPSVFRGTLQRIIKDVSAVSLPEDIEMRCSRL